MLEGLVLNIQRMSTEDGPGLRTSVFFKGCPLACRWCHNPESISFKKEHEWFPARCMMCGTCEAACEKKALSFAGDKLTVDYSKCVKCMKCVLMCPTGALEAKGISYTADELFDEIIKDRAYFGAEGGVTLSGGEALGQPAFAGKLLEKLKAQGIHTAVDTCGQVKFEVFEKVYDNVSLFLYDLKLMGSAEHKRYTGHGNEMILDNLIKLSEVMRERGGAGLWIRTPLIPGATDGDENIRAIAEFIENNTADVLERWELLEFNNLCASKYERLGKSWEYKSAQKQSAKKLERIKTIITGFGKIAHKTFVAGQEI
jgi:pyruvate formate lyase activating enzyme